MPKVGASTAEQSANPMSTLPDAPIQQCCYEILVAADVSAGEVLQGPQKVQATGSHSEVGLILGALSIRAGKLH